MDDRSGDLTTLRKGWRSKEFLAPRTVFYLPDLTAYELLVYLYLCHAAEARAAEFPSYPTIAARCHVSRDTAIRSVRSLVKKRLLQKESQLNPHGGTSVNLYTILLPKVPTRRPQALAASTSPDGVTRSAPPPPGRSQPRGGVADSYPPVAHSHPPDPECPLLSATPRVAHSHPPVADSHPFPYLGSLSLKDNNNNPPTDAAASGDVVVVPPPPADEQTRQADEAATSLAEAFANVAGVALRIPLAAQLLQRYGEAACRAKLELLRQNLDRIHKGPVPWYRAALEGDWTGDSDWVSLAERKRLARERAAAAAATARREAEESRHATHRETAALAAAYDALTQADRDRVDAEVDRRLKARLGPMATTLAASTLLQNATRREVMAELCPPPPELIEEASSRVRD